MTETNTIVLQLPEEYLKIHVHSLCQIAAKYGVADKVYINDKNPGVVIMEVSPEIKAAILQEHFTATSALLARHFKSHLDIIEEQVQFEKPALYSLQLPEKKRGFLPCLNLLKGAAL